MALRTDDKSRHLYLNNVDTTMISHTNVKLEIDKMKSENISQTGSEVNCEEPDENVVPRLDLNKLRKHEEDDINDNSSIGSCTSDSESVISYLNKITLELQDKLNTVRADCQFNLSNSSIEISSRRSGTRLSRIVSNHIEDVISDTKVSRGNRMLYNENTFKDCVHAKNIRTADGTLVPEVENESQKFPDTKQNTTLAVLSRNKYLIDSNDLTHTDGDYVVCDTRAKIACESSEVNQGTIVDTMSNLASDFYNDHTIGYPGLGKGVLDAASDKPSDEHKFRNMVPKYEPVNLRNVIVLKPQDSSETFRGSHDPNVLVDGPPTGSKSESVDVQVGIEEDIKPAENACDIPNDNGSDANNSQTILLDTIESKTKVKDIGECSLDYLIRLSNVRERCALLNGGMTQFGCDNDDKPVYMKQNLSPIESTNMCVPKPWFKYPLVEKLKPVRSDMYNVFNTCGGSRASPSEFDGYSRDIERYIHEQSTYRLDVEDCDRHNVMDPFLEYERVKGRREDLQDTEWAKYGRPAPKQCRIVKNDD